MDDSTHPPPSDRLTELIAKRAYDDAVACLGGLETASANDRKAALRAVRSLAGEQPSAMEPLLPAIKRFLTDEERSVRLTTAKILVSVAAADPEAVVPVVSALADRLADDGEFYYVRARSAEALGYTALERPETVASPEVLADLRVGLSFDEPEVTEKLAKALEHVAIGNPRRLQHQVSTLADHLDDRSELVRYHLCTALVAIGCEHPEALRNEWTDIAARLDDENAFVRGRAVESLGLLARADPERDSFPRSTLEALKNDEEPFVSERARFAVNALDDEANSRESFSEIGSVSAIREATDGIVATITAPSETDSCPHCDLSLPENGPPVCPRCGAPQ